MEIHILPKGKDRKHHVLIKDATLFFINKLMSKRHSKKIRKITIRLFDSIDYGMSRGDCREVTYQDGTFDISLKVLSTETFPDMLSTLAHETIHAKQVVTGEFSYEGDIWTWKGKKMRRKDAWYKDFTPEQQRDRLPWETEAYGREKELAKSYFVNYYNSIEVIEKTK